MSHRRFDASHLVVLAGITAALHIAKLPPAVPVLQQSIGLDLVQAGFLLSTVQLAGMTLGLLVGLSVDHIGLRRSMVGGLLLLSVSSLCGGWVESFSTLLVLRALEGFGFLCVVMPAPALIRQTVDASHLSARLGVWGAYMPTGSALALCLGPWVMQGFSWPVWWWFLGICTLLSAWAVWRWVPPPPTKRAANSPSQHWTQRLVRTLRSPGPWWVSICFAVYSAQWLAVIGFLPTVYAQMGLSHTLAGWLTASVALVNVAGNLGSGRLLQAGWRPRSLLHIGFACMAVSTVAAFAEFNGQALPLAGRYVAVLLFSACGGLIPGTLFSAAVQIAPDESTVSTTVGYMQQWSALGQFAGPPLVAWLAARHASWQWTWCVTVSFCLVGTLLAFLIQATLARQRAPAKLS